jgi:hypothetical protein
MGLELSECHSRLIWNRVGRLWDQAETASRRVKESQRQGQDARGLASMAGRLWKQAEAAFAESERSEAGWRWPMVPWPSLIPRVD